ncbi:MAG: DNA translocase FtsK 4TM domain-containing protein, partial [Planctomycetales bacterium]|nr:DNA translocase FtsK 4TM domain-containing protein [Planctomycetales bacterium]
MDRSNVFRRISLFLAFAGYVFLLISLASFSSSDWPSHNVYPYPAIHNLCGSAGALVAYYAYWLLGQGIFPMLFFAGVLLVMVMIQGKVSDFWMRAIGSLLLTVAFAAIVHNFMPTSATGFPEGQGGLLGIGASHLLQAH